MNADASSLVSGDKLVNADGSPLVQRNKFAIDSRMARITNR